MSEKSKRGVAGAVLFLLLGACSLATARAQERHDSGGRAHEARAKVQKLGTGIKSRVKIELVGGRKLEGYVERIGEEHFYVVRTDREKGTAAVVAFGDVLSLKAGRGDISWRDVVYRTGMGAGALLGFLRDLGAAITPAFPAAP